MTVFINPGPDLSASTYFIQCHSLFDFSNFAENDSVSVGDREIALIREVGDRLIQSHFNTQATTDQNIISDYRRSNVAWFDPHDADHHWLIKRLSDNIAYFNALNWNFDLTGFVESCQYTIYDAAQLGHYDWHLDAHSQWNSSPRKLSVVIQLSDPSEYDGGEFCIKTHRDETILPKEKGTLIMFPSYILHKVKPVTSGVRRSFVCWISGPKLR